MDVPGDSLPLSPEESEDIPAGSRGGSVEAGMTHSMSGGGIFDSNGEVLAKLSQEEESVQELSNEETEMLAVLKEIRAILRESGGTAQLVDPSGKVFELSVKSASAVNLAERSPISSLQAPEMESVIDAKVQPESVGRSEWRSAPQMPVGRESFVYKMTHRRRGRAVIINQQNFSPALKLNPRKGTNVDRENLKKVLFALEYEVLYFDDLLKSQVLEVLKDLQAIDHSDCDSLVVCYLSHGDSNVLFAKDKGFAPSKLWEMFTADLCPSLAGKPKCFFIQACRGDKLDSGVLLRNRTTATDALGHLPSMDNHYKIPAQADFLFAFSSIPGFMSWRNTGNGSWFVQALCKALKTYGHEKDLLSILTIASRCCAVDFESECPDDLHFHGKKQVPYIASTLTREIWFPRRSSGSLHHDRSTVKER